MYPRHMFHPVRFKNIEINGKIGGLLLTCGHQNAETSTEDSTSTKNINILTVNTLEYLYLF